MKEIPIDKTDNCKRILETGHYQTDWCQDKEDWWLIKYLKDKYKKKGLSGKELKDEIKSIWEPIYKTRIGEDDYEGYSDYIDIRFDKIYYKGDNVSLKQTYHSITIYESELNYINSLPAPKWVREFIFIFLGHSKATRNFIYEYAPISDYISFLSLKSRDKDLIAYTLYDKLNQLGLWKEKIISTMVDGDYFEPEKKIDVRFVFDFPISNVKDDKVGAYFDRQIDLLKRLDLVTNVYNCEKCGKPFEIKNRTQRFICEECYKKERNKRKHLARDLKRKEGRHHCDIQ